LAKFASPNTHKETLPNHNKNGLNIAVGPSATAAVAEDEDLWLANSNTQSVVISLLFFPGTLPPIFSRNLKTHYP
jgi:hypothetical protein